MYVCVIPDSMLPWGGFLAAPAVGDTGGSAAPGLCKLSRSNLGIHAARASLNNNMPVSMRAVMCSAVKSNFAHASVSHDAALNTAKHQCIQITASHHPLALPPEQLSVRELLLGSPACAGPQ